MKGIPEMTIDLRSGVKIYDNDWFLRYHLSTEAAADVLASWNVTYVISQSRYLPMQDSAVASAVAGTDQGRYGELNDEAFREMLASRGIAYFACLNIGFDPIFTATHPDLVPIDQHGRRMEREDWYIGLPPDRTENLAQKIGLLERGAEALRPDGVHLGFVRWPGFWETWLPETERAQKPEYCFSPATIARFRAATGVNLPADDPVAAATLVASRYRTEWTRWKCRVTVEEVGAIRAALDPVCAGLQFSINTLPFFPADFGGAVAEVFGQDVAALGEVVDVFEVMAYHQIMGRPASWPGAVATDIRARSGRSAICTVQARPLYLEGMHAGLGRARDLDLAEFSAVLDGIETSPIEGVCIFTFTDLLAMRGTRHGTAIVDRLRRFRR